jgi:hypothetical protein
VTPIYPFMEVYVRPPLGTDPAEPVVTLSRDSAQRWWHTVGGKVVRQATPMETLLPLAPKVWKSLGFPAE